MPYGALVSSEINDPELAALTRALTRPMWYDPSTGTMRVQLISGTSATIGTVTTVTTVTGQTNLGGVDAKLGVVDVGMRNLWGNSIRRNIT